MTRQPSDDLSAACTAAAVTLGKAPPHNLEAEVSVLGGVLLDPTTWPTVAALLTPADFYQPAHGVVFEALRDLVRSGSPLDAVTLVGELRARDRLNTVGGVLFVSELTDTIPTTAHIERYARIVADLAARRRLIGAAHAVLGHAWGLERPTEELCADLAREASRVAESMPSSGAIVEMAEAVASWYEVVNRRIELRCSGERDPDVTPTGIPALDALLGGGLRGGRLYTIAGRPGSGKSAAAVTFLRAVAAILHRALFFCLEMAPSENIARLAAAESGIPAHVFEAGSFSAEQMQRLMESCDALSRLPVGWVDAVDMSATQMAAATSRDRRKHGTRVVFVDYGQLARPEVSGRTRQEEVSATWRSLKLLAKRENVAVVVLAQMSRGIEQRGKDAEPQLSDLRESGAIEQDSDVVIFTHGVKDGEGKTVSTLYVRKQRGGPTGKVPVKFLRQFAKFVEDTSRVEKPEHHDDEQPFPPVTTYGETY